MDGGGGGGGGGGAGIVFEWQDERRVWKPYDAATQQLLQEAYERGATTGKHEQVRVPYKIGPHRYAIDLAKMEQRNIQFNTTRPVRHRGRAVVMPPRTGAQSLGSAQMAQLQKKGVRDEAERRRVQTVQFEQHLRESVLQTGSLVLTRPPQRMQTWGSTVISESKKRAIEQGGFGVGKEAYAEAAATRAVELASLEIAEREQVAQDALQLATDAAISEARAERDKLDARHQLDLQRQRKADQEQSKREAAQLLSAEQEKARRVSEAAENARQESAVAGFTQGLGYLATKRVDLSGPEIGAVTAAQIEAIARHAPDLEALFLPEGTKLSASTLMTVRQACPRALCLELGCEVDERAYVELCAQHERHDTELACLLPNAGLWEGTTPAEGVTGWSTRTLSLRTSEVEAEHVDGSKPAEPQPEPEPEPEPGDGTIPVEPEPQPADSTETAAETGAEETAPARASKQPRPTRERSSDEFLSAEEEDEEAEDEGPHLDASRPSVARIFRDSVEGDVERLKQQMKRAIDDGEYDMLDSLRQAINERLSAPPDNKCRVLDLSGRLFDGLTDAGFAEVAKLCPDVTAVFLPADTRITNAGLNQFRRHSPKVQCIAVGAEVTRLALTDLLKQYKHTKRIDLRDSNSFGGVTGKGLSADVPM